MPFNSLSHPTPEQTPLQAGGVLTMSGPIADIRSNIPQHLAVASPPTIKSSLVSDTRGPICVLWPTPSPLPLSHPNLSVTDRTDLPCSNPPPCQQKDSSGKSPPGPTEDGLMNQTCARSFPLITEVSPGINTPWLQGATYCDLPQFPSTEGHSPQEPVQ